MKVKRTPVKSSKSNNKTPIATFSSLFVVVLLTLDKRRGSQCLLIVRF